MAALIALLSNVTAFIVANSVDNRLKNNSLKIWDDSWCVAFSNAPYKCPKLRLLAEMEFVWSNFY